MSRLPRRVWVRLAVLLVLAVSGGAMWRKWNELSYTERGVVIGGGTGAVVGGAVGGTPGAVVGGAGGAVAGGTIGFERDLEVRPR